MEPQGQSERIPPTSTFVTALGSLGPSTKALLALRDRHAETKLVARLEKAGLQVGFADHDDLMAPMIEELDILFTDCHEIATTIDGTVGIRPFSICFCRTVAGDDAPEGFAKLLDLTVD